jgi:acylphosphatase
VTSTLLSRVRFEFLDLIWCIVFDIRRRAIIHGHVQGVFFREETRRRASALGVGGWVSNLPDGTVEAVFEGDPGAVEAMLEFVAEGPALASVDRVDVEEEEPQGLDRFEVR